MVIELICKPLLDSVLAVATVAGLILAVRGNALLFLNGTHALALPAPLTCADHSALVLNTTLYVLNPNPLRLEYVADLTYKPRSCSASGKYVALLYNGYAVIYDVSNGASFVIPCASFVKVLGDNIVNACGNELMVRGPRGGFTIPVTNRVSDVARWGDAFLVCSGNRLLLWKEGEEVVTPINCTRVLVAKDYALVLTNGSALLLNKNLNVIDDKELGKPITQGVSTGDKFFVVASKRLFLCEPIRIDYATTELIMVTSVVAGLIGVFIKRLRD